ncbi:NADH dehydrogenase, G subunit, partial [mine drainage metagenome]
IPRFCYHHKLPIAANCRQCLVEVEMGGKPIPKPQPACATPVAEGMKVHTHSEKALHWQRDVMEFLLINHPLDCPICDQGGECELQDVSLGYGRSVSRYNERKRVVADEDLGPLVATEMTRCIQCTRCVRFMSEIAGTYELGGMSRGEHLEIGTYIGKSIDSELSGNIIDVCPVGALTDKVYRFQARAWELIARSSIGYHDALGSNLWLHTRRGEVLRTVPRDNEAINECWLSDRDRYSHQGLYAGDRAQWPLVKRDGAWIETDWDDALGIWPPRACARWPAATSACWCSRRHPARKARCWRVWPKVSVAPISITACARWISRTHRLRSRGRAAWKRCKPWVPRCWSTATCAVSCRWSIIVCAKRSSTAPRCLPSPRSATTPISR